MGFLANLFKPKADTIGGLIGSVGEAAKDIREAITGDLPADLKAELESKAKEIEAGILQAQAEINKVEAASNSIFVAGWRPFIGWVCGLALAFHFIIRPIVDHFIEEPLPLLDINSLYPIILGMLGLVVARTYEKKNNVQGNH